LLSAAVKGSEPIARLLLQNGAEVDAANQAKATPLQWAAYKGFLPVVKVLLENGADVDARDKDGQTPLLCAAAGGSEPVVRLLLQNGADINAKDHSGRTPLFHAVFNNSAKILGLLLEQGAEGIPPTKYATLKAGMTLSEVERVLGRTIALIRGGFHGKSLLLRTNLGVFRFDRKHLLVEWPSLYVLENGGTKKVFVRAKGQGSPDWLR